MLRPLPALTPLVWSAVVLATPLCAQIATARDAEIVRSVSWLDQPGEVRRDAARALIAVGPAAVPALCRELIGGSAQGLGQRPRWEIEICGTGAVNTPGDLLPYDRWLRQAPVSCRLIRREADLSARFGSALVAAWVLGEIGDAGAVAALAEAAVDGNFSMRCQAIEALETIGPPAAGALTRALAYPVSGRLAARALAELGEPAVPALLHALRDEELELNALLALGWMAPDDATACLGELIARLASPDPQCRALAAWVLANAGTIAVPSLMQCTFHFDPEVRRRAVGVLCLMGRDARPAALVLVDELDARDEIVARWAATALGGLQLDERVSIAVMKKLAAIVASAEPALRLVALENFGRMLRTAPASFQGEASRVLITAAASEDPQVRAKALALLGMLRARPDRAVAALTDVLRRGDHEARCRAAAALGRLGAAAAESVPDLVTALGADRSKLRAAAARALGKIGPAAREALPALEKAAQDPVRSVAGHAQEAVRRVGQRG